ncbi:sensor histidine kinase [Paenibacillus humicus]|uniref:sensor histidine kinase n=1 Tax=Paenibacillus humicus TaxID=412861 RepID=UPI000FD7DD7F|nr:HAMP domain-containing sensor histidine kinase [Paenibacillus humicus]
MKARSLSRAAWLRTACGSAAAAIAAAAVLVGTPKSSKEPDEAKRLALYWSGYASAYAGLHGSADGMEEALRRDAAAHPAGGAVYLEVRTAAGETIAVAGEDGPRGSRLSSVKPFMLDGRVAGTVEASVASSAGGPAAVWPAAAGMAAFVCAWGLMRLEAARGQRRLRLWADEAKLLRPSGSGHTAAAAVHGARMLQAPAAENPAEAELSVHLSEAADYIQHLQTVRKSMVGEVAHELRTPLAVLLASLDNALYEERALDASQLAKLSEQARGMARLVQDLQDLSLAESGRLALDKRWFAPAEAAAAIAELLEAEAGDKGIRVRTELDEAAKVFGDEKRIRQLLLNLSDNALRHARTTMTVRVAAAGSGVRIEVEDDGWGMEEEELDQLFQRYVRRRTYADGSPAPRGLGLGLAVVKGIAEAHGGSVGVSSRFGAGALFYAELPAYRE